MAPGRQRTRTRRHALRGGAAGGALVALAACGTGGGGTQDAAGAVQVQGPAKVQMNHIYTTGPGLEALKAAETRFKQEHPNIEVNVTPAGGSYFEKLLTQIAADSSADIVFGSGAVFQFLLDRNAWQEVSSYLKRDRTVDLGKYYLQADTMEHDGKQYGLPFSYTNTVMYYNKTLFRKAGVAEPTERWTWDDALDAAKKIARPEENQWGLLVGPVFESQLTSFIWGAGGDYINKERTRSTMDHPGTMEALQWVADLYLRHRVAPPVGTVFQGGDFVSGQVAMRTAQITGVGPWAPLIGDKFEWDVTWLPKHPRTGLRKGSHNANPFMLVNPRMTENKNPEAAWLFLKHLAGPATQGLVAESRFQGPALMAAAADKTTFLRPPPASMHLHLEHLKTSEGLRFHKYWLDWYNALTAAIDPVFKGQKSVRDAALEANQKGDLAIKGMGVEGKCSLACGG